MTAQTVAYLKASEFTLTGTAGRIVPAFLQDACDSFAPWDINPSGGAPMPYVYQGFLHGSAYFQSLGGIIGSGALTTTQQKQNANFLQSTITYALNNNLICWLLPGIYQIYGPTNGDGFGGTYSGLLIPGTASAYGFALMGSMYDTQIIQYYPTTPGIPVLTIGDTTSTNYNFGLVVSGLALSYGVAQGSGASFTGAQALVLGTIIDSVIENISIVGYTFPSCDGIYFANNLSANAGVFSNNFRNIYVWGVQRDMLRLNGHSTGNHWDNVYLNNGGGSPQALTGYYLNFLYADLSSVFTRLNCEWGSCNQVIHVDNYSVRGVVFNGTHIEGITLTGAAPRVIYCIGQTAMTFNGVTVEELVLLSGNLGSGVYGFISDYNIAGNGSNISINGISFTLDTASCWTSTLYMYVPYSMLNDDVSAITIENGLIYDNTGTSGGITGHFTFDSHLALNVSAVTVEKWGRYSFGTHGSTIEKLALTVTAAYTHYGQLQDATIIVPATITGFTITLGVVQGATGTQPVRLGNTVRIRRLGAQTNTGTLALSGATLGSVCNNGQSPDFFGIFGGVSSSYTFTWASYTPVT